ncbi:MAG: restriction system protein [Actinoplanes sp.]|jgi:restriction system protein|nr:restriction system protein [Actinoplanes sp.]
MHPDAFERLIAQLFQQQGLTTTRTGWCGDGGVNVIAEDPTPITDGQIVIQVKRYRATVSSTAVRDLYGVANTAAPPKGSSSPPQASAQAYATSPAANH